jgi:hypothetical protein
MGQTASGRFDVGLGCTVKGVDPFNPFPKKVTSVAPKISKLGMVQYEFERNKLPFWEKSKFVTKFELKN